MSMLQMPEITGTTVIRWILRVLLVFFLMWLAQQRKRQEDETEEDEDEGHEQQQQQQNRGRQDRGNYGRDRDGYGDRSYPRQRNNNNNNNTAYQNQNQNRRNAQEAYAQPNNSGRISDPSIKLPKPKGPLSPTLDCGNSPAQAGGDGAASFGFTSPLSSYALPQPKARPAMNLKAPGGKSKRSGHEDKVLNAHSRPITHLAFNEDGTLLFTCGKDKLVIVWSLPGGECLGKCMGHQGAVWSCSVTKDSKWLVSCGADQKIIVWDREGTRKLAEAELTGVAKSVAWARGAVEGAPEGARFAICVNKFGSKPPSVGLWEFDSSGFGSCTKKLSIEEPELPGAATQVCWGLDDAILASCHESGEVMFWNPADGALLQRLQAHEGAVSCLHFAQDYKLMVTCGKVDMQVRLWDVKSSDITNASNKAACSLIRKHTSDRALNCVALRPSLERGEVSKEASSATGDSGLPCQIVAGGGQDAREVALVGNSSDQFETLLFRSCAKEDDALAPYAPEQRVRGHFGPIHSLAFSPDGAYFASGSEDGCARLHKLLAPGTGAESAAALAEKEDTPPSPVLPTKTPVLGDDKQDAQPDSPKEPATRNGDSGDAPAPGESDKLISVGLLAS